MHRNTTSIFKPRDNHYEIIIPAAGMGKRMKSYGPKALIQLKNPHNTILSNQLNIIKKLFRTYTIILICGFEHEKIMNYVPSNIITIENERYEQTNVVRSIGIGLRATRGNQVLIIYGDLVFNLQALNCNFDESCMIVDHDTMSKDEVGCIIQNGHVRNISYDLDNKWGQITYLTGKELSVFKQFCWNVDNENKFGFEGLNHIINNGGKLKAIKPKNGKIIDVDKSSDIIKAKDII